MPKTLSSLLGALVLLLAGVVGGAAAREPGAGTGSSDSRKEVSCEVAEQADLETGDIVEDLGVGAAVPAPGEGVTAWILYIDGSEELNVDHTTDGRIIVSDCGGETHDGPEDLTEGPTVPTSAPQVDPGRDLLEDSNLSSPRACNDGAYNLKSYKWFETMKWRFNASTTPGELSQNGAEQAMIEGTGNITRSRNNCGLEDYVGATHDYLGRTDRRVDFINVHTSDPDCAAEGDGVSVVDFGDLERLAVASHCTYRISDAGVNTATESDVRFNKDDWRWTANPAGTGCLRQLSVEGVMTHERGHTFGLDHVGEKEHGNLTMSERVNGYCQNSEATLGLGDVRGLRARY